MGSLNHQVTQYSPLVPLTLQTRAPELLHKESCLRYARCVLSSLSLVQSEGSGQSVWIASVIVVVGGMQVSKG